MDGGDDGLVAAIELRRRLPAVGVLVLSQFNEESYALDLIGDSAEGVGYLLKERVGDVDTFVSAIRRVATGGTALDAAVVQRMLGRDRRDDPLRVLTPRELAVLAVMAEGKSNMGVAEALSIADRSAERLSTPELNRFLSDVAAQRQPPQSHGRRLRMYYMAQFEVSPPRFAIQVNDRRLITRDYAYFVENQLRERFGLEGVPLVIDFKTSGGDRSSAR